ncbi:hypothetical protein [Cupriavidus basilensis]|uniref:hypothetical protein n=1 Tax=Cupriavidus basilensis TaxID=68895 RepID=UPI001300C145|nr:hypothetical protein [Cupriavidus basilensis]
MKTPSWHEMLHMNLRTLESSRNSRMPGEREYQVEFGSGFLSAICLERLGGLMGEW